MKTSIKTYWLKLTQPHPSLTSNADRVRSQALASVLVVLFTIAVLFEITAIALNETNIAFLATELPVIALVGLMIIPSRRRYYPVVALSLSIVIIITCYLLTIISAYQPTLVYMTLGYLIVATALPTRWSLAIGVMTVMLTIASPMVVAEWDSFADITIELTYIIIATIVIYALTFIQRYYMTVNEEKSQQLTEANELLHEKIKHLEETQHLKEQTQLNFSKVFHSSPDPIVINRLIDGKYIAYNQSFKTMMGYEDEDLNTMSGRDLFADEDTANRYLKQLLREKQIFSTEFDVKTKSGEVRTALLSAELIDWHGEKCVVCMARDITAHKVAQQHKLDIMKEQERAVLLEQFIRDASHDFRTPLATIGTSLHLIRRLEDEDRRRYHLTIIERQAQRINAIVDNLTTMYMLDSENVKFQYYPSDINQLVQNAVEQHPNPDAIPITTHFAGNLPQLEVDDYYLTIAIRHLLDNALRFTSTDGIVTVSTERCTDTKNISIHIEDTGIGMDEDTLKNSFNRLYRGDSSRNQDTGGAGLGLSITQKIIEKHHGMIIAHSTPNEGSSFRIVLPIDQSILALSAD